MILVADPAPLLRRGLLTVLSQENAGYCLHEAGSLAELLALTKKLNPALVITAANLPGAPREAVDLLDLVRKRNAELPVVVLSDRAACSELSLLRLLRHGVNGLLSRDAPLSDVSETVSIVLARGKFYDEHVRCLLRGQLVRSGLSSIAGNFTKRQMTVLHLIANDHSNEEIAEYLETSVRTVEYHRRQMLQKVGTRSTVGLVLFALREGVLFPRALAAR